MIASKTPIVVLEILTVVVGLVAAYFWWKSAQVKYEAIPEPPKAAGDGNTLIQLDDGKFLHFDARKQAALNSKAAIFTAISVALQAIVFGAQNFS